VNYITLVLLFASGSAQKNGSFLTINIVRLARGDNISSSAKRERVSVFPENSSG
jgi:hypothetical protein